MLVPPDLDFRRISVQLDFSMPERFELKYTGADNQEHHPVMIHRAILGSLERFIGILIEEYAGKFPLWLAPVQAAVVTVTNDADDYANEIYEANKRDGIEAVYGIYGLSSYAFRILSHWEETGISLQWLADSDRRLSGKSILNTKIYDVEEFQKSAQQNAERGIRTVCFVAAVNAHRIETFLRDLAVASLDVFVLPPDCQNRK